MKPAPPVENPVPRQNVPRVLVVDDSRAIHEDFRKILCQPPGDDFEREEAAYFGSAPAESPFGAFAIDTACQGQEAAELVRQAVTDAARYSMAFLDVRMPPGWDGIETAGHLWAADPDLEIVICTAYSDYSWDEIVRKLGNRDNLVILKKPFDPVEVLQLAHALCRKWELHRESKTRFAQLEKIVEQRTEELRRANRELEQDIVHREKYETRLAAFCKLNHQLSVAKSIREAGQTIVNIADQLLGWDACTFDLYSAAEDKLRSVFAVDTIEGSRAECVFPGDNKPPSAPVRRVLTEGPQLVLKSANEPLPGAVPFGAANRPSASILYVPVRDAAEVVGVLSIQSYTPHAYDRQSLDLLLSMADHCGGALARLRTEEALHKTQERLNHLLRQSPAVIYSARSAWSAPDWISNNVFDLIGCTSGECCSPGWWESHVHPEDWNPFAKARSAEREQTVEYRLRHKSGEYRWVRDQRRQVRSESVSAAEIVGTWIDITAQKELEDQLRQSQKMEAIGQLAGGVAHDFNNLLAVILGNAEMALSSLSLERFEEISECLRQVVVSSQKAANLTRQLLAFSRKQVLNPGPLDLNEVIANLAKMLRRIIGEHIELHASCAPAPPVVNADLGAIEQVLMNLVVNSRDAMPHGGKLRIATAKCSFDGPSPAHPEARRGEFVRMSVEDTGAGIAPEHLSHMFEPFFTTKEVGKGTGLGLATAHGIVKQHEGWIEVSSRVGTGAEFRIYLPASKTVPAEKPGAAPETAPARGAETILLVEDDPSVRKLTALILGRAGYKICPAASGPEALELWKSARENFDLLLTDVLMPEGMTGVQLAERLCGLKPALKVVFMSGYSGDNIAHFKSEGLPPRLLRKPFLARDLLGAIRETLDGKP